MYRKSSSTKLGRAAVTHGGGEPPEKPRKELEKSHSSEKAQRKKVVTSRKKDAAEPTKNTSKGLGRSRSALSLKMNRPLQPKGKTKTARAAEVLADEESSSLEALGGAGVITAGFPTPSIQVEKKKGFFRNKGAKIPVGASPSGKGPKANSKRSQRLPSTVVRDVTENSVDNIVVPGSAEPESDVRKPEDYGTMLDRFLSEGTRNVWDKGTPSFVNLCIGLGTDYPDKTLEDQARFITEVLPNFLAYMQKAQAEQELEFCLSGAELAANLRKDPAELGAAALQGQITQVLLWLDKVNLGNDVKYALKSSLKGANLDTAAGRASLRKALQGPLREVGKLIGLGHWFDFLVQETSGKKNH